MDKEEKGFFKTCFNTVAGLEVKNENQAIAKEVVLSEIENLQQENKQLKDNIRQIDNSVDKLQKQLIKEKDNWNKLKEYVNKMHEYFLYTDVNEIYKQSMKEDNSFPNLFNLSELNASDRILSSIFKKMQELEQGSDSNE